MQKKWFYLFLFFLGACIHKKEPVPAGYNKLLYKPGDCIAFETDNNNYGTAIVYDIKKDSSGWWYAMCFLEYADSILPTGEQLGKSRFSGRKVENSVGLKDYVVGIDVEWVNEDAIATNREKTRRIVHYNLKPMPILSEGISKEYDRFLLAYKISAKRRSLPPDSYLAYREKPGSDFRPEEFFPLKDFIIQDN
jgi:hypothetical protein